MRKFRWLVLALVLGMCVPAAFAADFSPFTFSPTVSDAPDDGKCIKGRFECRWGGDCAQRGDKCYSCTDGYTFHDDLGCYKCGDGQSLILNENNEWRCVS
jgi:hypothetical protein